MGHWRKTLRWRVEIVPVVLCRALLCALPFRAAFAIARGLGRILHFLLPGRVRLARFNLAFALRRAPDDPEVVAVVRKSFEHLVLVLVELLLLKRRMASRSPETILEVHGIEKLHARRGQGCVIATGHLGNWEILGALAPVLGVPLTSVGRRIENPLLDAAINDLRTRFGQKIVDKDGATLRIAREIKGGSNVALLLDQHAGRRGVQVEFLGRPASTFPTAAYLARRFDVPVIPIVSRRRGEPLTIHATVLEPIHADPSLPEDEDVYRITLAINRALQSAILECPEQYLWLHRRWKGGGRESSPDWVARYAP